MVRSCLRNRSCHVTSSCSNAAAGHAIVRGALRVRQLLLSRLETAAHRTLQNTPEQRPPSNVNRLHLCQGAGWLHCQPYPDKVLAASPSLLPCLREKHADPGNPRPGRFIIKTSMAGLGDAGLSRTIITVAANRILSLCKGSKNAPQTSDQSVRMPQNKRH